VTIQPLASEVYVCQARKQFIATNSKLYPTLPFLDWT